MNSYKHWKEFTNHILFLLFYSLFHKNNREIILLKWLSSEYKQSQDDFFVGFDQKKTQIRYQRKTKILLNQTGRILYQRQSYCPNIVKQNEHCLSIEIPKQFDSDWIYE
jgi:hypothetical protein